MTTIQTQPRVPPNETVEQQYYRLKAEWYRDTAVLSNPVKIMSHPAMRAIIAMGDAVVPVILRDLKTDNSVIVWALPEIVGSNPPFEGNNTKMVEAWQQWGRERGLL